jgi:hypothetical protein
MTESTRASPPSGAGGMESTGPGVPAPGAPTHVAITRRPRPSNAGPVPSHAGATTIAGAGGLMTPILESEGGEGGEAADTNPTTCAESLPTAVGSPPRGKPGVEVGGGEAGAAAASASAEGADSCFRSPLSRFLVERLTQGLAITAPAAPTAAPDLKPATPNPTTPSTAPVGVTSLKGTGAMVVARVDMGSCSPMGLAKPELAQPQGSAPRPNRLPPLGTFPVGGLEKKEE